MRPMRVLLLFLGLLSVHPTAAQSADTVYTFVSEPPRLLPSQEAAYRQMASALSYPPDALRKRVQGTVLVRATVDTTGRPVTTEVLRGVGAGCDEAVVRGAAFSPALHQGRRVAAYVTVPLRCPVSVLSSADFERLEVTYHRAFLSEAVCETGTFLPPRMRNSLQAIQHQIRYPQEAMARGIERRVILQFIVDEDGHPRSFFEQDAPSDGLLEAAAVAVRQARFDPATCDGVPVPTLMTMPLSFIR